MCGIGNVSAARELSAVRGFLRFVGGEDARVPMLKGPRVKRGLPRPVSPDEAVALAGDIAETAREEWIGARDWAVLLLLRSEEHTSELQSLMRISYAVLCLKKKK